MAAGLEARLTAALGSAPRAFRPLGGGCVAEVYRAELADGRTVAVKVDPGPQPTLDLEAWMLQYLRRHSALPMPTVLHSEPGLLALEFLPGGSVGSPAAAAQLGELLADLHGRTSSPSGPRKQSRFGLERDTLIGPLHQPNPWTDRWVDFFREHRLLYMAREAHRAGQIGAGLLGQIEQLAGKLESLLPEPSQPALLHGDCWGGNVLAQGDRVTGLIDPAVYYGHPEIELAFTRLFHSFPARMYEAYHAVRPIAKEFYAVRENIYNLYPLLVHARLFGGGYAAQVAGIVERFR